MSFAAAVTLMLAGIIVLIVGIVVAALGHTGAALFCLLMGFAMWFWAMLNAK